MTHFFSHRIHLYYFLSGYEFLGVLVENMIGKITPVTSCFYFSKTKASLIKIFPFFPLSLPFLLDLATHIQEREGDGKQNILWGRLKA